MTKVLKVNPDHPEYEPVLEAARMIQSGGLVAFPTETVYGLGAHGLSATAVRRIFEAKRRPSTDPLILHVASPLEIEMLTTVSAMRVLERQIDALSESFWPGALTLVLPRGSNVPLEVTGGGNTVAVRVPSHKVAQALIRAAGVPIAAPSANLFSRPSPTSAADVLEDLKDRVDIVLDGGLTEIGLESTVLDLTTAIPTLLRPGGVPLEELERVLGEVALPGEVSFDGSTIAPSPGMQTRHYAPRAKMVCLMGAVGMPLRAALRKQADVIVASGQRLGLLLCHSSMLSLDGIDAERVNLGACSNQWFIASQLFMGLRALDRAKVDVILTHGFADVGLGRAINDRLYRASEGQVVQVEMVTGRPGKTLPTPTVEDDLLRSLDEDLLG
jgi:L-threonylcarbamoyladenylate synthase